MQEDKGTTEDEMVAWHHRLHGHEFEQAPVVDDTQEGLACCSACGRKESNTTEGLNWTDWTTYSGGIIWSVSLLSIGQEKENRDYASEDQGARP